MIAAKYYNWRVEDAGRNCLNHKDTEDYKTDSGEISAAYTVPRNCIQPQCSPRKMNILFLEHTLDLISSYSLNYFVFSELLCILNFYNLTAKYFMFLDERPAFSKRRKTM